MQSYNYYYSYSNLTGIIYDKLTFVYWKSNSQSPSSLTLRVVSSQRITESICTGDEKKGGRRAVRQSLRTLSVASATLCVLSFSRKSLKLCASAFKNVPSGFSVCAVQSHFSFSVAFVLSVTLCELVNPLC